MNLIFLLFLFGLISLQCSAFADQYVEVKGGVGSQSGETGGNGFFGKISGAWNSIKDQIKSGYANGKDWLKQQLGEQYKIINEHYNNMEGKWNSFIELMMKQQSHAKQYLEQMIEKMDAMRDEFKSKAAEMSEQHLETLKSTVEALRVKVVEIKEKLSKAGIELYSEVKGYRENLMQKASIKLQELKQMIENQQERLVALKQSIINTRDDLKASLGKYFVETHGKMELQWNQFIENGKNGRKDASDNLKQMLESAKASVKEYSSKLKEMSKQQLQKLQLSIQKLNINVNTVLNKYLSEENIKINLEKVSAELQQLQSKIEVEYSNGVKQ